MSKIEVYLNEDQVSNLKHILTQSAAGYHLLFDRRLITETLQKDYSEKEFFKPQNIKKAQDDLLKVLEFRSLFEKQIFIKSLSKDDQERLVRAYFYIIEDQLLKNTKNFH